MGYESHAHCDTPDDDMVLWRYMDFVKFVSLVENDQLWFSRLDLLDDPHEGKFTDAEYDKLSQRPDRMVSSTESARVLSFVSCWQESTHESMAMWDLYGGRTGSIAVKTTVKSIKDAISLSPRRVFIGKIKYVNWSIEPSWHDGSIGNLVGMCVRKHQSYKHESEVRLVILAPDEFAAPETMPSTRPFIHLEGLTTGIVCALNSICPSWNYTPPEMAQAVLRGLVSYQWANWLEALPKGLSVQVSRAATLIHEVVVGPREPQWFYDLVCRVLRRYECPSPIRQSEWTSRRQPER
jgi:hypothetical protein